MLRTHACAAVEALIQLCIAQRRQQRRRRRQRRVVRHRASISGTRDSNLTQNQMANNSSSRGSSRDCGRGSKRKLPARCVVCVAVSAAALRSLLLLPPKPLATAARAEPSSNFVVHERALALSASSAALAAARSRAHAVCDFTYCCCSSSSSCCCSSSSSFCCCCFQFVCALTCLPVWAAPRLALCKRALS